MLCRIWTLMIRMTLNNDFLDFSPTELQLKEFMDVYIVFGKNIHQYTMLKKGEPVLLIGLNEFAPKNFEVYTIFSKNWKPVYYKDVINFTRQYVEKLDYDRIIHHVHEDRPWTIRMAEVLGLNKMYDVYGMVK